MQKGGEHIALEITAPPVTAVAAAPRPFLERKLMKLCYILPIYTNMIQMWTKTIPPSAGRITCPAIEDPKKRTAPPPMIP